MDLYGVNALAGAVLSVVHPQLFDAQLRAFDEMWRVRATGLHPELMEQTLENWSTPFNTFTLISNQGIASYQDSKDMHTLPHMLSAFGKYKYGRLKVPLLDSSFLFNPGAVVILPADLIEPGAKQPEGEGERICIASFVKPAIGNSLLWRDQYDIDSLKPPSARYLSDYYRLPHYCRGPEGIWSDTHNK